MGRRLRTLKAPTNTERATGIRNRGEPVSASIGKRTAGGLSVGSRWSARKRWPLRFAACSPAWRARDTEVRSFTALFRVHRLSRKLPPHELVACRRAQSEALVH